MPHSRYLIAMLVTWMLAAVLIACVRPEAAEPRGVDVGAVSLDETEWVLTSLNGRPPVARPEPGRREGPTITLEFHNEDEFNGFAGCNSYGGHYSTDGGDLAIPKINRTEFDCDVPEKVKQQEAAYFETLANAAGYRVQEDRLTITNAAGQTSLTFALKQAPPLDPALAGPGWVLTSLNGAPPVEGTNITLDFSQGKYEGRVGGFAGCNTYGGTYVAADEGVVKVGETAVTLMLCQGPAGVMEQEEAYIDALRNAAGYRVTDGRLEIESAAGETALVFRRKPEYPMDPADLVGTEWRLVSLAGDTLIEGSIITLAFHNDHLVIGHAGCREYVFAYRASSDDIRFPFQAMMVEPCLGDEALMRQEGRYTESLGWATDYRMDEGQLEIFTARGEVLVFEPLPDDADAGLEGTPWRLQGFVEEKTVEGMDVPLPRITDLLKGTDITAMFGGGVVSGSTGCNGYNGRYQRDGSRLAIGELVHEEKACETPAGIMAQEQRYLDFLADVTSYRIIGRQLWLGTDDGRALVFGNSKE